MSQSTMISALSSNTENHAIRVRVGRIWEAINKKTHTLLHTNVILLDEQVCLNLTNTWMQNQPKKSEYL